jgi:hypothetical protein
MISGPVQGDVTIISQTGNTVKVIRSLDGTQNIIDISELGAGIYILRICSEEETIIRKITVVK